MATTTQYSRHHALLVLVLCAVVAGVYFRADASDARQISGPGLAEIELAIADPDAASDLWLLYGKRLAEGGRYAHAVMAFEQVLAKDPYCRVANIDCAAALALANDADGLQAFVSKLVLMDPRLTQDILGRAEARPYLSQERFKRVQATARIQSMD